MSKYFTACRRRHPQLFFLSSLVNGGIHPLYSLCIPHSFFPENEESVKTLQVSFTSSLASLTPPPPPLQSLSYKFIKDLNTWQVKQEAETKAQQTFPEFKASEYATQVVAGTNYFIKVCKLLLQDFMQPL